MKYQNILILSILLGYSLLIFSCQEKATGYSGITIEKTEIRKLRSLLEKIYDDDQKHRQLAVSAIEQYGLKSTKVQQLAIGMNKTDSLNLIAVKSILTKYGWLSSKIIGEKANSAIFLVIQHGSENDRKHFLPIMRKAVLDSAASKQDLAKLEDRVATDLGKNQIYGTQVGYNEKTGKYYVLPIENPKEVDVRRGKIGLGPISVYLSQWQIQWKY